MHSKIRPQCILVVLKSYLLQITRPFFKKKYGQFLAQNTC